MMTSDRQRHSWHDNERGVERRQQCQRAGRCQSKGLRENGLQPGHAHRYDRRVTSLLYSIPEVCQLLKIGRTTLFAEMAAGELTPVKIHARTLFHPSDVAAYVERKRGQATRRRRPASHPRRNVDDDGRS